MLRDGRLFGRKAGCFTLQWHLTNRCGQRCRHCYDRSRRDEMGWDDSRRVVRELVAFSRKRRVRGRVSLTGGDPFLSPHFFPLCAQIAAAGLDLSILGNPTEPEAVARLADIRRPSYFQVSLEGLEAHNDEIRGPGSYRRVMDFLPILRSFGIYAAVMLTLTRDNLDQVIPLGEKLRGRADRFTFSRLSPVGEGADLELPTREEYAAFLKRYSIASRTNPVLAYKDSLLNIVRHHYGRPLFGGCTGFGCGAAFNFIALLPDGEAHACRKFPSPIGNVLESGLAAVYGSPRARRYRRGCRGCRGCAIRNRCGGCLAVGFGQGLDIFREPDPHCFMGERELLLAPEARTTRECPIPGD